jgi:hypothetical protein
MDENGLSAPFTYRVNKSITACMYMSQPHLFISDGPAICSLYTFMPTCLYHTDNPSEIDFNFTFKSVGPTEQICILKYKLKLLFCHRRTKRANFWKPFVMDLFKVVFLCLVTRICWRRKLPLGRCHSSISHLSVSPLAPPPLSLPLLKAKRWYKIKHKDNPLWRNAF